MLEHLKVATRPRWVGFTVFVLFLIVTFVLLGRWQLHRAHQQAAEDAMRDAARTAATTDVGQVTQPGVAPPPAAEWRSVTATGTYDSAHQLLVRNRTADPGNGYLVIVPLRTAAGPDLLVMRGWIPSGDTASAPNDIPTVPTGVVTVEGRLRLPEPSSERAGLPAGQVERIVPSEVAALTGRPTYGGWVALGTEQPSATGTAAEVTTLPDGSVPQGRWPISHTVYAVQWFIFGLIAVVGWVILLRRDVQAEALPAEHEPATHDV